MQGTRIAGTCRAVRDLSGMDKNLDTVLGELPPRSLVRFWQGLTKYIMGRESRTTGIGKDETLVCVISPSRTDRVVRWWPSVFLSQAWKGYASNENEVWTPV